MSRELWIATGVTLFLVLMAAALNPDWREPIGMTVVGLVAIIGIAAFFAMWLWALQ